MIFGQIHNYGNQHRERLLLVRLENVQEVVVFEEAHRAVSHLQVVSSDRLHNPFKEARNQVRHFFDFAHFEHLLQLSQKESFFDAIREGPVLEQPVEERYSQSAVFGEEEHGAAQKLFVKLGTCLDLVQRDDYIFEENYMFVAKGHRKTRNDRG